MGCEAGLVFPNLLHVCQDGFQLGDVGNPRALAQAGDQLLCQ